MTFNPDGPPERFYDSGKQERQRLLAQLKAILRTARERREPWYVWVLEHRERRLTGSSPAPAPERAQLELEPSDDLTFS